MKNIVGVLAAIFIALALLGTGAAKAIMGTFTNAFGWTIGGLMGICLLLAIVLAVLGKK